MDIHHLENTALWSAPAIQLADIYLLI